MDSVLAGVRIPVVNDTVLVGFFKGYLGVLLAQRAVPKRPFFPLAYIIHLYSFGLET